MSDMLQQGTELLAQRLKAYASHAVEYRRGLLTCPLLATPRKRLLKVADGFGNVQMVWTDVTFQFPAADLILGGDPATPLKGDIVADSSSGTEVLYEVLAPSGEPPWRYSDPYQVMIQVHTKAKG